MTTMDLEIGNAGDLDTNGTGWIIGFSDWTKSGGPNLRHMPADLRAHTLCVKWYVHPPGHPNGDDKPISEGRTITLLVGQPGEFRTDFSLSPDFPADATTTCILRNPGDYALWGPGIYHRSFGIRQSCILTLRWQPELRD